MAYYLLVGEDVFRGHSLIEACGKQLHEIPESPSARSGRPLPEALERLVLDCLEKLPERRPQSAREFLQRLAQVSAEAWDASQAEAWWREHGSSVRAASSVPASTSQTIQVDIGAGRIP